LSIDLILRGIAGLEVTSWIAGHPRVVVGVDVVYGIGLTVMARIGVNF
jgi:hypothetical protein